MELKPKLFLTVTHQNYSEAASTGFLCACLFYRIGKGPVLLRSGFPVSHRGGIMVISDSGYEPGGASYGNFSREIVSEISRRGFSGALLDVEDPSLSELVSTVSSYIISRQIPVFLSPRFSKTVKEALILIPSAISGGSYEQMIKEAAEKYGEGRLALEVVRISSDFALPFTSSDGKPLSRAELEALKDQKGALPFFSRELCAKYFTYSDAEGKPHFVLFDDASTLDAKLRIAASLGIKHAFALYPDITDLLPSLADFK
ncbi:MAG: hypothetical protein Q8878_04810 [Bacillota bacterium]|nr:hypothetical protein [Bacillota bacterium]